MDEDGVLWYSVLDLRDHTKINANGAAANANLETITGALFGSSAYIARSYDLSPITFVHSTAATGVLWSLASGTIPGVDGDGFVGKVWQSAAFDAADETDAPDCNHNFSPKAGNTPGGCQALAANCANFARIGAL